MAFLLNDRERDCVEYAAERYQQRFGTRARDDPDLFLYLGDNARNRLTWSGVSGKVPTFRTNGGRMYSLHREAWLTPKDRLAVLGFPVTPESAGAMGVPILPVADNLRAASVAGNSFHFMTAAIVQLVALCSFKLVGPELES